VRGRVGNAEIVRVVRENHGNIIAGVVTIAPTTIMDTITGAGAGNIIIIVTPLTIPIPTPTPTLTPTHIPIPRTATTRVAPILMIPYVSVHADTITTMRFGLSLHQVHKSVISVNNLASVGDRNSASIIGRYRWISQTMR
jgi:hypothetical protein